MVDRTAHMTHREKQDKFVEMVKQHERLILKVCALYTHASRSELRDLYQDAVCALWESYDTFQNKSKPSTWIYAVTRYTMMNVVRKRSVELSSYANEGIEEMACESDADRMLEELREALTLLTPEERDMFIMWMEGFKNEEIAQVMNLSYAVVATRLTRTRQKLRRMVGND